MVRLNSYVVLLMLASSSAWITGCGGPDPETGSSQSSNNSSAPSLSCNSQEVPFTPLRRLTRFEYANTVSDLLGVDTSVVLEIPADEADGFDNNSELQIAADFLIEKYVTVSESLATQATADVNALTGCNADISGAENCALNFARDFGRKAFRRPLTAADEDLFMEAYSAGASHQEGIAVMIRMALQSPNFLYRLELSSPAGANVERTELTPYEVATRLAYFIWSSGPDDDLLDAAAQGRLSSKAQIADKAREMLASPKARVSLANFIEQWSGLRKLDTMTKNTNLYPNYSNDVRDAMKRELPAFLDYMFANNDVSLETLFTANVAFVSGPLADIYNVSAPFNSGSAPARVTLPEEQGRAGLLTQAGFMAVQGHPDQTSPVLRGKFVRAKLLCDPPPPPPDDVDISVPEITVGSTARDRADIHISAGGSCSGCHLLMDPIGLAFEHFDALGQFREFEAGNVIDVSGEVHFVDDPALQGTFRGVNELADKLAESELVMDCVTTQMFRYASGRRESSADACSIESAQQAFIAADGDFVELMVAMTQTDAFLYRNQGAQ